MRNTVLSGFRILNFCVGKWRPGYARLSRVFKIFWEINIFMRLRIFSHVPCSDRKLWPENWFWWTLVTWCRPRRSQPFVETYLTRCNIKKGIFWAIWWNCAVLRQKVTAKKLLKTPKKSWKFKKIRKISEFFRTFWWHLSYRRVENLIYKRYQKSKKSSEFSLCIL